MKLLLTALIMSFLVLTGCTSETETKEIIDDVKEEEIQEEPQNEVEEVEDENSETDEESENTQVDLDMVKFFEIEFSVPEYAETNDISEDLAELGKSENYALSYILDRDTGTNINVVSEELPNELNLSLEEYYEIVLEQWENEEGFEVKDNSIFKVNDTTWIEINGVVNEVPLIQRTSLYNNRVYIFSFGGFQEGLEKFLPDFEAIIKSVQFLD